MTLNFQGQQAILEAVHLQQRVEMSAVVGGQMARQATLQAYTSELLARNQSTTSGSQAPHAPASRRGVLLAPDEAAPASGPNSAGTVSSAARIRTCDFCRRLVSEAKFNQDVSAFWTAWKEGKIGTLKLAVSWEQMESNFQSVIKMKGNAKAEAIKEDVADDPESACCKAYAREWRGTKSGKNFVPRRKLFVEHIEKEIKDAGGDEKLGLKKVQGEVDDAYKQSISNFIRTKLKPQARGAS